MHIRPGYCYFISNSVLKIGWFFVTIKRLKIFFRLINYHSRLKGWLKIYYRSLPGKLADKLVSMDKAGASNEELAQTMGGLRGLRIGMLEGNTDEGYIALGTGIGNIRSIKSVAEVVNELAIC
ncbi:hypothetical protein G3C94_000685 [Salmonella enterica]|nr:hypothetical protein [Salmonella enterica]EHW8108684.1 hypothetical protein [Salmonella enterica]